MTESRNYFLSADAASRKLHRMAYEIAEQLDDDDTELILAGIRDNGVILANIIAAHLAALFHGDIKVIELSLNKRDPGEIEISEPLNYDNSVVIVIDDVTNTGKTLLYALKPFLEFHPKRIHTLTLVERSHKLFPVNIDFVGISLATTLQEHIFVEVQDGQVAGAYLQ
jgi:pyrimidine operon attenuation protein/uracil phosphoribosyltransferase